VQPTTLAWTYLVFAGLLEIAWAVAMKYSQGFSKLGPALAALALGLASFYFLTLAANHLPIGTAYAVWTGIGAVGTAIFGMMLFAEPRQAIRLISIGVIVVGILGLQLTSQK